MKLKELMKPTLPKIIVTIILAFILLTLSGLYVTNDLGSTFEVGFPLPHGKYTFYELPPPGVSGKGGSQEFFLTNYLIDAAFWLIVSYAIVSGIRPIFQKNRVLARVRLLRICYVNPRPRCTLANARG